MGYEGLLKFIVEEFAKAKIRYALIGGLALHTAGYSRATGDVDLLIHCGDVDKAKAILLPKGYGILHESNDVLNLSSPWVLIGGIDMIKAHRHYALTMLQRAKDIEFADGLWIPVAEMEDIIGLKVQAIANDPSREARDLADIEWLMRAPGKNLDQALIKEHFDLFSMSDKLTELQKRIDRA